MSISLTGTGGLYSRLGKYIKAIRALNGLRAETAATPASAWGAGGATVNDVKTAFNAIEGQFQSTLQDSISTLYGIRDQVRSGLNGPISSLAALMQTTLIRMANDDATLVAQDLTTALKELNRQMTASSDSIDANATSISIAAVSSPANTGNATVIGSVKNPKGVAREYLYAEVMEVTVTGDSGTGSTAGSEPYSIKGEVKEANSLNWNWPDGSGASASGNIIDPSVNAGANFLYNSDFEDWAGVPESHASVPDRWYKAVGTIGTHITKNTSSTYLYSTRTGSAGSLALVGDGSTLTSVYQKFGDSTNGTSKTLKPNTVYGVNVYVKRSAAMTGVLAISLVDSSMAVINDDAGTANTISKDVSTLGASFEAISGFIITPKVLPVAGYRLAIRFTTALENAKTLYLDDLAMCEAKEAYTRGPWIAAFRGSTEVAKGDGWNATVSNDYGGLFQTYVMWSVFNAPGLDTSGPDVQTPSNAGGAETIADSLCE